MAFLSPLIENWLWKWYREIEKKNFKLNLYFFSGIFNSFCAFLLQYVWNVWKYLCGNHDYTQSKKEADSILKKKKEAENNFLTLWLGVGLTWFGTGQIYLHPLTHWGRVTHICVVNLTTIGSDNHLSPGRRQAIIWTNDGISLIGTLGTNFSEILIGIQTLSFKKIHLTMLSAKWHPFVSASMR